MAGGGTLVVGGNTLTISATPHFSAQAPQYRRRHAHHRCNPLTIGGNTVFISADTPYQHNTVTIGGETLRNCAAPSASAATPSLSVATTFIIGGNTLIVGGTPS
jgi:hypothetical protein